MNENTQISQDQLCVEIKRAIITSLFNSCASRSDPDGLVTLLWKISKRRKKFFESLARWGVRQMEKGYTQERVIESLLFFGPTLAQNIDKNINYPLKK